jgi:RNA polymerase sigma-70 factor (ECF subfamily)
MGGGPADGSAGVGVSFWPDAYTEHAPGLRSFLRRRLRSADLAEDLTQDTFVRAMNAEGSLRDPGRIRPYLYQIAHRLLLNHLRRPALVRTESELGATTELETLAPSARDRSDETVRERELKEAVGRVLDELPADQALAFTWAVLEQRSYAEIEEHTRWSRSKIKISVFRARQRIMKELDGLGLSVERKGDPV